MKIKKVNEINNPQETEHEWVSNDGWNTKNLELLNKWMSNVERLAYEIRNARRGSYALDGEEPEDLVAFIKNLSMELNDIIDEYEDMI